MSEASALFFKPGNHYEVAQRGLVNTQLRKLRRLNGSLKKIQNLAEKSDEKYGEIFKIFTEIYKVTQNRENIPGVLKDMYPNSVYPGVSNAINNAYRKRPSWIAKHNSERPRIAKHDSEPTSGKEHDCTICFKSLLFKEILPMHPNKLKATRANTSNALFNSEHSQHLVCADCYAEFQKHAIMDAQGRRKCPGGCGLHVNMNHVRTHANMHPGSRRTP